jgi:AcrR family transcriptional regulator
VTGDTRRRGRPRQPETDARVLRAAADLLREKGPAGVTIEAVSARSSVARTTIYRRFDSRRELIAAVIGGLVDRPLPPPELPLHGKVRWVLDQVSAILEDGLGRGGVAALIADTDPEFSVALRQALGRRLDELREQIQEDMDAGVVAGQFDPGAVVSLLLGVHLGEVLRTGTTRRGWDDGVVDLVAHALGPASDSD